MSKAIKQMEMDVLKNTFKDVREMVLLSATGLSCTEDNQLRQTLRKKNIRLQLVKNSLTRRVFGELGIRVQDCWAGPTFLAWGTGSLAELSRELETLAKKFKQIKFKKAVSEGNEVSFDQALKMPTRTEAIGMIVSMIIGPASQIAAQVAGPAGQIAGQIQKISEKTEEVAPAA